MLQLNADQVERLIALKLERDMARVAAALGEHFPAIAARLGDRLQALVRHGVPLAAHHGLDHALCVGRYLACWFMLGVEFETRPGFTWARDLLVDKASSQGAKVFQLCRRTRDELARLAASAPPASDPMAAPAFDLAIAALDAALMRRGTLGSLQPGGTIQLGAACDIDALDLRLLEPAPPLQYRFEQAQWLRLSAPAERQPITLTVGTAANAGAHVGALVAAHQATQEAAKIAALPPRLNLLCSAIGKPGARWRLRARAAACCDAQIHPLLTLNGPPGLNEWRGVHTHEVLIALAAPAAQAPAADRIAPTIATEGGLHLSTLELSACGLRDSGASLGALTTTLAAYPGEQHLLAWRREPGAAMSWPEPETAPPQPPSTCRVERDGVPLDRARWQAGLDDLDRQLGEGLGRLASAWARVSGVSHARLQAEPAVLSGSAGITWGWADHPGGLQELPYYRVAGAMDLVGCQLNLRLGGDLLLHGARSRITLHCSAATPLQLAWQRRAEDADLSAVLAPAQTKFAHPFTLDIEAMAGDELAMIDRAGPVVGALIGSCGLRPCSDGNGWQWFASLDIAPVSVVLQLHDPVLGQQQLLRPLLPAVKLLDWSLG